MDFIIYIVIAVVAFFFGWHARGIIMLANLSGDPDKIIKMLEEIKRINADEAAGIVRDDTGTELFIERVGNSLYAYIKDTNQFVAQGSDLASVLDTAHKRFPTQKFFGTISKDNPAKELAQ
jgi:hypothetical protein